MLIIIKHLIKYFKRKINTILLKNIFIYKIKNLDKHKWSSGRIVACHAIDPGSIPGLCSLNFFLLIIFIKINITNI